jgi:hypothetical protein
MIETSTLTITCPLCGEEHVISPLSEALKSTEVNGKCTQLFTCPNTNQIYHITFKREE